ncbi:YbhB/YbcL family Raf kinase inhibitor-like protein [Candidatus Mycoplasma pogonae]
MKKSKITKFFLAATPILPLTIIACGPAANEEPKQPVNKGANMNITSTSVDANGVLKPEFSKGSNRSPQFSWDAVPGAKSYAIALIDKDATDVVGGIFFHWIVGNIKTNALPENAAVELKEQLLQFENSTSKKFGSSIIPASFQKEVANTYFGPYPPDQDHLYELTVVALNTDNAFEGLDVSKPLFFPDFEKAIAGKVLKMDVYNFVGPQVKDDQIQVAKITNKYFKSEVHGVIKNIKINDSNTLPKKYFATLNSTTNKYEAKGTPKISWNKVDGAKSYFVFLNNSNNMEKWGLALNNWNVYGIAQPADGDTVVLEENGNFKTTQNSYSKNVINQTLPETLLNQTVDISTGMGLVDYPGVTDTKGFYTVFVFATDLDPTTLPNFKTSVEALTAMRGHVLAQGLLKVKAA